jgi:transposase InsO family protein
LSSIPAIPKRDRWAHLRFSIIGPLLAAPPEPGQMYTALRALAERTWRHPITGQDIRFAAATIERWYYAARHASDPVGRLRDRRRGDRGAFRSLTPIVIAALRAQYEQHPGWTVQLHYDNLRALLKEDELPSYPTIRRYLRAHGLHRVAQPARASAGALAARERLAQLEVRSYEVEHVNALWHLDFHHGSRKVLTPGGEWVKPMLLGVLDDHSRLVCHLQWYLDETAESMVHGLCQAFMKRGLPRALMTDNGAAMVAEETVAGLRSLSVLHQTTLPYSPYQNGKQESFWGRIEGRLMPMLEGEEHLTLDLLNLATQAWVEQEYHRSHHAELGATPLRRYLAGHNVARACPSAAALVAAFRIEVVRRQRRSDGTFSLDGTRFEIPARYRHLASVHVRYARWDKGRVDLVDPVSGAALCAVAPLDRSTHAGGARRRLTTDTTVAATQPAAPDGIAPLLRELLADYASTGLPPAYLPKDDKDNR